jgi:UDP-perosamine 4-acetyltransferase
MREKVIVLGAGGHAKVVIDILKQEEQYEIVGCLDVPGSPPVAGIPVLGDDGLLPVLYSQGIRNAFVALGRNTTRQRVSENLLQIGYNLINVVSKRAIVSTRVSLGKGVVIMPGAIINTDTVIADGVIVNTGASIDHDCQIGPYVHIAPGCHLAGCVMVGEQTFVGIGACVIPGIRIGERVMVGAGAAVIRDLENGCTAVGVPAKVIKESVRV